MRVVRAVVIVWLGSVGVANAATRTAATCNSADVQTAINAAARGDTVVIPNGSCTWTSGVTISGKGIIVQGQTAGGVTITNNAPYGIVVIEDTIFHTQIWQLTVTGSVSSMFIRIQAHTSPTDDGKAILVHHLTVRDTGGIRAEANRGVI